MAIKYVNKKILFKLFYQTAPIFVSCFFGPAFSGARGIAFLDFRKTFDTEWREWLLSVAWNIGIRGKVWNVLDNLYKNVQCNVISLVISELIDLILMKA